MYNMAGPQGPPLVYGPGVSSSSDPLQTSGMGVDPLQGSGDPWATTPWISFSPGTSPAVLPGSHSSGSTATWQTGSSGQSGNSACHIWNATRVFRFWFSGHGGPAQAVMAQMLRQQMLSWTSTTTSAADTNSSVELYRAA